MARNTCINKLWWIMPEISTFERQRQEGYFEFRVILGYIMSSKPAWATE